LYTKGFSHQWLNIGMFQSSQDFANPADLAPLSGEARLRWLRGTRQLDVMHPRLVQRVQVVLQGLSDDQAKAVALHDAVRALPFGCVPDYSVLRASDILTTGYGDCFTKGMLFVAMLRAAQIPARLRFVSLPIGFLFGIVEPEEATIMHAMAEVLIAGKWRVTDSYVPDIPLQTGARKLLLAQQRPIGYGVHLQGDVHWDGLRDASSQCTSKDPASLPLVDWGVADDPEAFYADKNHSELRRNFATRLKWRIAAPMVNKRVDLIRQELLAS
jgi:hypothetical protein